MGVSDLFSTSFLFSIAIIIILIGGIFAYVSYRMGEQDHKLSSMVNLVSILAQDLQFVKSKLNTFQNKTPESQNILPYQSEILGGKNSNDLISVSDEEDDEEVEDDQISEEDYSIDEDSEVVEDDEEEDDDEDNNAQEQIKLLNLTLVNEDLENDSPIEDLNCDFEEQIQNNEIKTIHLENPIELEETTVSLIQTEDNNEDFKINTQDLNDLKHVSVTDLAEHEDNNASKSEYKKMPVNKLREVVVNKGVITDASKLKKQDILKLLGDE